MTSLTESQAESLARQAGWTRHTTRHFQNFGAELVPFYFYNAKADFLEVEVQTWAELCRCYPPVMKYGGGLP